MITARILIAMFFSTCISTSAFAASSKAASYLLNQQVSEACDGKKGTIDPGSLIERDLTGDGEIDLIIAHEGITCAGGGRSLFCGIQVCSFKVYVRKDHLLKLEKDMLGVNITVDDGRVPTVHWYAHGGAPKQLRWNGRSFQ